MPAFLFVVGVVSSKHTSFHGNGSPIISTSDQLRICADLCSSGLGGQPCGEFCFDLIPKQLPHQSTRTADNVSNNITRADACPVLCKNRLGYPLCQCQKTAIKSKNVKPFQVNFNEICDYYCQQERWWLRGCPVCATSKQHGGGQQNGGWKNRLATMQAKDDVDWGKWCDKQCAESNGGSACNCDLLPFSLLI